MDNQLIFFPGELWKTQEKGHEYLVDKSGNVIARFYYGKLITDIVSPTPQESDEETKVA